MARLYGDENFDHGVIAILRTLGHDAETARDVGLAGQGVSDPDQLAYAIRNNRAVLTFNRRHFRRLHIHVRPHCGIITCTGDVDDVALAHRIHNAICGLVTLDNQLIRIYRPSTP